MPTRASGPDLIFDSASSAFDCMSRGFSPIAIFVSEKSPISRSLRERTFAYRPRPGVAGIVLLFDSIEKIR